MITAHTTALGHRITSGSNVGTAATRARSAFAIACIWPSSSSSACAEPRPRIFFYSRLFSLYTKNRSFCSCIASATKNKNNKNI